MPESTPPARSAVPVKDTWNAESVFPSPAAWEAEYQAIAGSLREFERFQGHLGESAAVLADCLTARDALVQRLGKLWAYASLSHSVNTADQAAAALLSRTQGLLAQAAGAMAFVEPELIALGQETVLRQLPADPRLGIYAHYVEDLFRQQAHRRSSEVEQVLGMVSDPLGAVETTYSMLTAADMRFPPARSSQGEAVEVTQGTFEKILAEPDREARRTAWESYNDTYLAFKNTLANNLMTTLKADVFRARVRRHESTLAASLFTNNIPLAVFYRLIETFRAHLPTWHRYWRVRRRLLGVERLAPYDIWAPLISEPPRITFAQAVDWIAAGLAPMGEDYVRTLRQGCLQERWVDWAPNRGKVAGAFSSGAPGTYPFIVLSFDDTYYSLGTLAHELGHSMHSYLTWKHQPIIYSDYALFVAEVASNFHQAMVRSYLLDHLTDRAQQIAVLEEAMSNFHRYLFIMPTLARFELEVHERLEKGVGVAADDLIQLMADLFSEGYGGEMQVDRERVGITWAEFGHLYMNYYVYQYATGISAANALSRRILAGTPGAVADYLGFLKAGSSVYPLDALKMAGVDMTTTRPVEEAFGVLDGLVDRLEALG